MARPGTDETATARETCAKALLEGRTMLACLQEACADRNELTTLNLSGLNLMLGMISERVEFAARAMETATG